MRFCRRVLLATGFLTASFIAGCAVNQQSPAPETAATRPAGTPAAPAPQDGNKSLFDGKTLAGWTATDFAGAGEISVKDGQIHLGMGYMTGITCTSDVPRMNYEISLEAMRVDGSDFFCGLTFPIGTNYCSFIVGGWGGGVVGLSSIDGEDASQNETTQYINFVNGRWYRVRLRVTPDRIQAWIDNERVVDLDTEEKRFSIRLEVEPSVPLGVSTWNTAAALRNITLQRVSGPVK